MARSSQLTAHCSRLTTTLFLAFATTAASVSGLHAQVDIDPATVKPAAWERIALRVVNQTDTAITRVRLVVPEALMVLGVEPIAGWTFEVVATTDTSPQYIEWSGGDHVRGEYRDYAFFGRLPPDARRNELVFPVRLTRSNGSVVEWNRRGDPGRAPTIQIVGTTGITAWGSVGLAGVAVGIAVIALALAVAARKPPGQATDTRGP